MTARRLRAPATDGGMLVDPPWGQALGLAASNNDRLSAWDYDVQGRSGDAPPRRRPAARSSSWRASSSAAMVWGIRRRPSRRPGASHVPLIVTGHQPELFHPGVWVKNFAASAIARSCGGIALNLIVDNDIPKDSSIRVPTLRDGRVRTVAVEFDEWQGEIPYEDWKVRHESSFAAFPERVHEALNGLIADPLLDDFWPRVIRRRGEVDAVGLRFSLARREIEAAWGVTNLELPLGLLCQTDSFLWFASHLIAQLPRYQQIHNACLAEYRAAHHIRSRHHPVAALTGQDEWLEAPFWAWRAAQPRRRALAGAPTGSDRRSADRRRGRDPGEPPAVPRWRSVLCGRTAPRPGGAVGPPAHPGPHHHDVRPAVPRRPVHPRNRRGEIRRAGRRGHRAASSASSRRPTWPCRMTLHLGLPIDPATPDDLAAVERQLRDLTFNPDRHLHEPYPDELRSLISAKRAAVAGPVTSRRERVARAMAIRRNNEAMQPWVEGMRSDLAIEAADPSGGGCDPTGSLATASLPRSSTRAAGLSRSSAVSAACPSPGRIPSRRSPAADGTVEKTGWSG